MVYETMADQLQQSATAFVGNLLGGIFAFCIVIVMFCIGIFVANILGMALRELFNRLKVEGFLESHGVHDAFVGFSFTNIAVALLKLYVVIAFIGIAADVVNVPVLSYFTAQATLYLPSLFQGVVILVIGLLAGDYITDRMKESKKIPFVNTVAILVELFIAYNAIVIAMPLLLPAADPSLLIWSFLVILAAVAFAFGLGMAIAVGLGLKDTIAEVAAKHKKKIESLL